MQISKLYIIDKEIFIRKIKNIQFIPSNVILVTADVVDLQFPTSVESKHFSKNILDERKNQNMSTVDFIKITEFISRNNYFEFNSEVKQQISGTTIGTKCTPTYVCVYMNEFENEFLSL